MTSTKQILLVPVVGVVLATMQVQSSSTKLAAQIVGVIGSWIGHMAAVLTRGTVPMAEGMLVTSGSVVGRDWIVQVSTT